MWLILGYGSSLHSDDRIGPLAADQLRARLPADHATVMTPVQLTPEIAQAISTADGVIFIDAAVDLPAGQIRVQPLLPDEGLAPGAVPALTHHCTPHTLLHAAHILYGHVPDAVLYTVGGADFSLGETLSAPVSAALPVLVDMLLGQLRAAGLAPAM